MTTKGSRTAAWLAATTRFLKGVPAFDELFSILTSGESPVATNGLKIDTSYVQNVALGLNRRSAGADH